MTDDTRTAPRSVRISTLFWLGAIGAAVLEMVAGVHGALADGTTSGAALAANLAVRLTIFALATVVVAAMRRGRGWARLTLAAGLGVLGTASLVYGPIGWLAAGHSVGTLLAHADGWFLFAATARVLHLAGVWGGLVLMFLPSANRYFSRPPRLPDTTQEPATH